MLFFQPNKLYFLKVYLLLFLIYFYNASKVPDIYYGPNSKAGKLLDLKTVFNQEKINETMKALKEASGFIRHELMDRVDIRHIPELEFVYDEYGYSNQDIILEKC